MQQRGKKLLATLLVLCMIVGFVPMSAQAAVLSGEDYITQQLYLGEDIVFHLRGNVPEGYRDGAKAIITYAGNTLNYSIEDLTPDENGLYDLPVELVAAQLTEEINVVLKAKYLGMNIEAINETYTVREYLKTLIEGNYTLETKALAQELLNYGAWAQKYFDYNSDNLANKGYDIDVSTPVPDEIPSVVQNGSVSGIQFYGTTVRFLSKAAVRFYFTADSVDGMTFTVDGVEYTPESNDNGYYIEVGGINPQDMDNEKCVAVTDGTDTLTVNYAPIYYFIRTYHNTDNENLKGLMEAAYSYFMAASDFAGVSDTGALTFEYKAGTANSIQVNTNLPASTALADFALNENGCQVNEDANLYQRASNVGMANVDGKIVLTFNFAENFTAGQTYSLPKNAFFRFTDNTQFALAQDYLFQFNGTDWTQVEASGDFQEGVDFEEIGNTLLFSGEGPSSKAATVTRVAYSDGVPELENGGEYALMLSHASSYYPNFRINFGKELAAGTKISFKAFGLIMGESQYNHSIFEFSDGGEATVQFACDQWTTLVITLPEAADHIDLFWNFERAGLAEEETIGAVYMDNFMAVEITGNILEGMTFEEAGNELRFEALGGEYSGRDATTERVAYASAGISANGGDYALKLSHASNYWPTFRINFGQELAAGTEITFDAYGKINGESQFNQSIFEFVSGGDATVQFSCDVWNNLTITLPEAADHIDLFWNYDRAGITSESASGEIYIDNIIAFQPAEVTGDFMEGVDFETAGNELLFGAVGGDNAWRDATLTKVPYSFTGVEAPANGGDFALKITCASSQWPVFRINFGKTLEAGTEISFQAYSQDTSDPERNCVSIFEGMPGEAYLVYSSGRDATIEFPYNAWADLKIVLAEDRDYVDLVCNLDRRTENGPANLEIYLDNFKAEKPVIFTGDFETGVGLEDAGDILQFAGITDYQAATVERVSYADANVSAPANGGSYALKVSHANNCWPNFRVNFGKTLKAGTVITFDVYGYYDYAAAEGVNKYVKLELTADSKNYAASEDPNQVLWTLVETWRTGVSITLTADSDHVDFFYNVADGQHGDVASRILMDNFKAVQPVEPIDITEGFDFEASRDADAFTGQGVYEDATIERVTYADMGVSYDNGGEYALKVSHAHHGWPTFRMNFGKTLKAGTVITFDVYGNYDYVVTGEGYKYMKLELSADSKNYATSADPNQVVWTVAETWKTDVTVTLTAECDHLDFFYNVADGQHGDVSSWLLLDNFLAVEPLYITEGFDFEDSRDADAFSGQGVYQDATIERVTYADMGVSHDNGGAYALKLSHTSHSYPTFRINFGKTLKAGTVITFDSYGDYECDPTGEHKYLKLVLSSSSISNAEGSNSAAPEMLSWMLVQTWYNNTVTLTADCSYLDVYCNIGEATGEAETASYVLLDNFLAVEPITISDGLTFDNSAEAEFFTGVGGDNAWRDASFEIVSFDGDNALKLTCASSQWPTFRINFGETLAAGTVITFNAYTDDTSGIRETVTVFEAMANWNGTTTEYLHGSWNAQSITLTADCTYVDIMCNMDRWSEPGPANIIVYIDDVAVTAA